MTLRVSAMLLIGALASGCAGSTAAPPPQPLATGPTVITGTGTDGPSAPTVQVSGPPGCAQPLSEYYSVIDNDVESGHLNPGVYNRLRSDLEPVRNACAAGREAEARNQLAAVKARYGYR